MAQNIARFEEPPDAEAVIAAAKAAGVHELIVGLPDGYETKVGENGSALSAGQAQRIALARALYRDPFLVVLDEPNSNLDAEGDEALTRAILGVRARGGIVVVVAHRPSAIAGVDYILVMAKGRQQQFGPKDEVLNRVSSRRRRRGALKVVPDAGRSRMKRQNAAELARLDPPPHLAGVVIVVFLAGGVGGWASTAEISGAVIAQGSIVVDSNVKKVQHPTGGVVGELRVRDGDRVKAGDIVVRLDETVTRANLAIVTKGLNELYARKARLEAERDGADAVEIAEGARRIGERSRGRGALASERKLFELRRKTPARPEGSAAAAHRSNCRSRSPDSPRSRRPRTRRSS